MPSKWGWSHQTWICEAWPIYLLRDQSLSYISYSQFQF
jgi:hypothetical protein